MLRKNDMRRYHHAAKIIETDGVHGYHTACGRYGEEVANFLLVAFLRRNHNPEGRWPAPEDTQEKVMKDLESHGLVQGNPDDCAG